MTIVYATNEHGEFFAGDLKSGITGMAYSRSALAKRARAGYPEETAREIIFREFDRRSGYKRDEDSPNWRVLEDLRVAEPQDLQWDEVEG